MTARPTVVLVDDDPAGAARSIAPLATIITGLVLPVEPWQLDPNEVRIATLASADDVAAALAAAVRGADLVLAIRGPSPTAVIDELSRVADVVDRTADPALSVDARALLSALAAGASVAEAARSVGLSLRSAHRRLAEARDRLGATTTTEAVLAWQRRSAHRP